MTAVETAPSTSTEAAKPAAAAPSAAPESLLAGAAKAAAAAPAAEAAKPAEAAHDYSSVKVDGIHQDTTKVFVDAMAEGKVDPKIAQNALNKVVEHLKARAEAAQKAQAEADAKADAEQIKKWNEELAKDPEFAADKFQANSEAVQIAFQHTPKGTYEELKAQGLDQIPVVVRAFTYVGRRLKQATSVDSVAGGPPAPAHVHDEKAARLRAWPKSSKTLELD